MSGIGIPRPAERRRLHFDANDIEIGDLTPLSATTTSAVRTLRVEAFDIDSHPVTCQEWVEFIGADGYRRRELWSDTGWEWRTSQGVEHPFYWRPSEAAYLLQGFTGDVPLRWRLPSRESAPSRPMRTRAGSAPDFRLSSSGNMPPTASRLDAAHRPSLRRRSSAEPQLRLRRERLGVRLASVFDEYPGFEPFPYAGYSRPTSTEVTGCCAVARGRPSDGSPDLRSGTVFPHWRAMPVGLRCVRSPST